jgi:hypothetical protein
MVVSALIDHGQILENRGSHRPAIGGAKRRCANCISYQETESGCTVVEGSIKPFLSATFGSSNLRLLWRRCEGRIQLIGVGSARPLQGRRI